MRHLIHVVLSVAMWVVFAYYWRVVLGRDISPGNLRAVTILGVVVVAGLVATVLWVGHNLRLARKFAGRRRATPEPLRPELTHDTIGRPVAHPGLDELRAARVVDVMVDEDPAGDEATKTYTATGDGSGA
jgi:hypothetical protein